MAFKFVVLCAALACANAGLIGAPVAHYSPAEAVSSSYIHQAAAPIAVAHAAPIIAKTYAAPVATYAHSAPVTTYAHAAPVATYTHAAPIAVGTTSQSVVRSLGGAQAVSHYSKAEDSAFSTVRKYDTRITNDAYSFAHAAPVATYTKTYAAPVVAKAAYAAPIATYAHAAPVATYAHAAPVATYAHTAPVAKAAIAYSPASVVSHTSFAGLGAHYECITTQTTMAYKFLVLCAALACANAGLIGAPVAHYSPAETVSSSYIHQAAAPIIAKTFAAPVATYTHAAPVATYAHAAPVASYAHAAPVATYAHAAQVAVHAPAVGTTSQSVIRSLGGAQAVSHYSKAEDSAYSTVRKYDTRITNDAFSYAHAAPVATYTHAAPVATYSHAAPVASYAHAAPVTTYAHATPVVAKTITPVATYAHAAPVATYAHAAPVATYAHTAPVATYAHAAPVVAKAALTYSPASVVSHTTFEGLGAHYQCLLQTITRQTTMAFKFLVFCAALACANAGLIGAPVAHYSPAETVSSSYIHQAAPVATYAHAAPATYAHATPVATYAHAAQVAVHAPAVGTTSQSVVRSLGGAQAVSHYSKTEDSAFSTVRKYDTRITNDAFSYTHATPVVAKTIAPVATYTQAAPVATYAHAAPVATYAHATYAHAAPVTTYAHTAPVVAKPALTYSPASVVSHTTFESLGAHYQW
ncbi:PREDICTED: sialidase-like [Nicrophorus vespilloides]|uniref:Sialidase-like n=1 Tax=Nicrophorus vespilloides TaxID=110193 RepID=A0ABM1MPX3_NICVS|nr:PREDICTED: sialidase-like [Nicrophorus vespilloides]